jgi:hypothetical protein
MNVLKLKNNLFRDGNDIISYETVVARIEGSDLIELGKFTKTTAKHIHYVAQLYKLNLVRFDGKKDSGFWPFEYGVDIKRPDSLSTKTSVEISRLMSEGLNYLNALAAVETSSRKDQKIITEYLEVNGVNPEAFQKLKGWYQRKLLVG